MNVVLRWFRWTLLALLPAGTVAAVELETTEVRLCTLSEESIPASVVVSPDCKRAAFVNQDTSGTWAVLDEVPGKKYTALVAQPLLFSPNSRRLAYVAVTPQRDKSFVVLDSKEWPAVESVARTNSLQFSPDSTHLAFWCGQGGHAFLMLDGAIGKGYLSIGPLAFSPDGRRSAFMAIPRAGKQLLVVNGMPGTEYDGVAGPVFSPDSQQVAYVCTRNGKQMAVVGSEEQRSYPGIAMFHSLEPATGEVGGPERPLFFSPDGKRLVYFGGASGQWRLVEGQASSEEWETMGQPNFSPDSHHLAYCAGRGDKQYVVYDGTPREFPGKMVSVGMAFSPDSRRFAHVLVRENGRACVVDQGVAGADYEHIATAEDGKVLLFSPDSAHLTFIAERNFKWSVVRDGIEDKPYYRVAAAQFSPDSKHLAYQADVGARRTIVVDGVEAKIKVGDRIIAGLVWDNANTVSTAVARGRSVFRLEVTVQ